MSRRNARKNAFVLLFQMEFNAAEEQEQMTDLFFAEQDEVVTEEDKAYTMAAVEGTRANLEAIDAVIDSFAKGWNTQRMNRVDLAILRLAVYELKYSNQPLYSQFTGKRFYIEQPFGERGNLQFQSP